MLNRVHDEDCCFNTSTAMVAAILFMTHLIAIVVNSIFQVLAKNWQSPQLLRDYINSIDTQNPYISPHLIVRRMHQ